MSEAKQNVTKEVTIPVPVDIVITSRALLHRALMGGWSRSLHDEMLDFHEKTRGINKEAMDVKASSEKVPSEIKAPTEKKAIPLHAPALRPSKTVTVPSTCSDSSVDTATLEPHKRPLSVSGLLHRWRAKGVHASNKRLRAYAHQVIAGTATEDDVLPRLAQAN